MRSPDTLPAAHALQVEAFRRMTPQQRVSVAFEMSAEVRALAESGVRSRHPECSDADVASAMLGILGTKVADEVRSHSTRG